MKSRLKRMARHLLSTRWQVRRAFPPSALTAIEHAIQASETTHRGEIRFAVEGALPSGPLYAGQSARGRAIDLFAQLRIWDTEARNGVLIYLLLADRAVEIVADRGVHAKAGAAEWEAICRAMEAAFRAGSYRQGVLDGIAAVDRLLSRHFPSDGAPHNELSDKVVVL